MSRVRALPSPDPSRTGWRRRWSTPAALALIAAIGTAGCQLWPQTQQSAAGAAAAVPTVTVTSGDIEKVVRLAGVTSSINFMNINAPVQRGPERRALILLEMLPSGARVKKGEVVALIDGQGLKDHIDDVHSTVVTSEADIKKRRAEQEVDRSNLEQSIRLARADWDKWLAESQAAEIRTVIDRELLDLGVEESEARHQQLQKDIDLKKDVHRAEVRVLELTTERHIRHRDRHAYDLERYTVIAPIDGMVVRQQIYRGGEMAMVEVGDQLHPGMLFLKVMDTDNMQVEASVNQAESQQFRIGMQARIGLDAFPELRFEGEIHSIGALARSGRQSQYVRDIPVRVRITGSDPRLIPDLSAYADVVLDRMENVARVPLSAVREEAGQAYVFVREGDGFAKRPVQLGLKSFTHAAVTSGLEAGEEIARTALAD